MIAADLIFFHRESQFDAIGIETVKVVPFPILLVALMVPECKLTME